MPQAPQAPRLDDRYRMDEGRILLSGTQALVRLPMIQRKRDLASGLNTAGYVSGYRGSPLAGLDREMHSARKFLADNHIVFRPGINEDMAATAVWGSQQAGLFPGSRYDGVFSMWYGKGPGVDRTMDVFRHANATGTSRHGGALLLAGDDHGAVSSTIPHQSEHNLISAMVPMLAPAGVAEYIDFGLLGWAMSRFSGAWVGFKTQTELVESTGTVIADPLHPLIAVPEMDLPADGLHLRWPDTSHAMERRLDWKMKAVLAFARANRLDQIRNGGHPARLGIVSTGKSWLDLRSALSKLGLDDDRLRALGIRLYKVGMVWPLEPEGLQAFASGLGQLLVVEEKRPVIEDQVKSILFNLPADRRPRVYGKSGPDGAPLLPWTGEINGLVVARALAALADFRDPDIAARLEVLDRIAAAAPAPDHDIPVRAPYFCSGCPHSTSTRVPEGSRASTGIGCHMMVTALPERRTSTFTQMGGEGGTWIGLAPFTDEKHIFVNMGDGTYYHSGLLAIRAAIASGVNATYKILYNDAVAMTGGQPHDGPNTVPSIVGQLRAEGARRVVVVAEKPEIWAGRLPADVEVHHRDELDRVQRELREVPGVTCLVYDQVCAAEKRRRRKRGSYPKPAARAVINDLVCEGCGDCSVQSNCISIEPKETPFGRKRQINQSSCNADLSCVKGFCPSFVTVEGATLRKAAPVPDADFKSLPQPAMQTIGERYSILLAGIGGTGVITVSAILSMAAHLDGMQVLTLDQTGLAQKNGAVMSHIRLAPRSDVLDAVRIGAGEADLVLGFDVVVAAAPAAMAACHGGRTHMVADHHFAPTASFVGDTTVDLQRERTLRRLREAVGAEQFHAVAASRLGTALLGDAIAANMLLTGHAWQRGLIPISLAAIEQAIGLNGAGVAMNLAAFNWGRMTAVDLSSVEGAAGNTGDDGTLPITETLDEAVARRVRFLTAYQDTAYAQCYASLVQTAHAAERRLNPESTTFSMAVARGAFKLMSYKDEYEVARLYAETGFREKLARQFDGRLKIRYHLAPPMLARTDPRTGAPAKIAFGPWMGGVFRLLARMKRLRGTALDPFGRTVERRMERRMAREYLAMVEALAAGLSMSNHADAVALAALPEEVRGFGHVKQASARRYEERRAMLLQKFHGTEKRAA